MRTQRRDCTLARTDSRGSERNSTRLAVGARQEDHTRRASFYPASLPLSGFPPHAAVAALFLSFPFLFYSSRLFLSSFFLLAVIRLIRRHASRWTSSDQVSHGLPFAGQTFFQDKPRFRDYSHLEDRGCRWRQTLRGWVHFFFFQRQKERRCFGFIDFWVRLKCLLKVACLGSVFSCCFWNCDGLRDNWFCFLIFILDKYGLQENYISILYNILIKRDIMSGKLLI